MRQASLRAVVLATLFAMHGVRAQPTAAPTIFTPLPDVPRISLAGLASTVSGASSTVAALDALIPVRGNNQSLLFGDVQGKYGQGDEWLGSLGAGYRSITKWNNIIGGYLFIDRSDVGDGNGFWIASPGVEIIVPHYSARMTAYFPLLNKQQLINQINLPTNISSNTSFNGHSQIVTNTQTNNFYNSFDTAGNGVDAEVGALLPAVNNLHAFLGGYFFDIPNSANMRGVSGRLEYPLTHHVDLLLDTTYDNIQHNTFGMGLKATFGGNNPASNDLAMHLKDPIQRNLATLNGGQGVPSTQINQFVSSSQQTITTTQSGVWFFSSSGSGSACTADTPCALTSGNLTTAKNGSGTNMYIKGGTGSVGSYTYDISGGLTVPDGLTLEGRSDDYTTPAVRDTNSPRISSGTITLGNNNTLTDMRIVNGGNDVTLVQIANVSGDTLNNVAVDALSTGINIDGSNNVTVENSDIRSTLQDTGASSAAQAIQISGATGTINILNNTITAKTDTGGITGITTTVGVQGIGLGINSTLSGIDNTHTSTINITGNTFDISATTTDASNPSASAVYSPFLNAISQLNTIHFNNNTVTSTLTTNTDSLGTGIITPTDVAAGLYLQGMKSDAAITLNASNNTFNLTSNGTADNTSNKTLGLYTGAIYTSNTLGSSITTSFSYNTINASTDLTTGYSSDVASSYGTYFYGDNPTNPSLSAAVNYNTFNLTSVLGNGGTGNAYGIYVQNAASSTNTMTVNYGNNTFSLIAPTTFLPAQPITPSSAVANDTGGNLIVN